MSETTTATKEYRIPACNLARLGVEIENLNKRARKLGVPPITLTDSGRFEDVPVMKDGVQTHVDRFHFIVMTGESPRYAGWTFAATIEHAEEANIIRKSPEFTGELDPKFRTCSAWCDHCRTSRNRRDTFILQHETGTLKQLGSDCIKDFLSHFIRLAGHV